MALSDGPCADKTCYRGIMGFHLKRAQPGDRTGLAPDVLERLRRHCGVAHRVRDRSMPQEVLEPPLSISEVVRVGWMARTLAKINSTATSLKDCPLY